MTTPTPPADTPRPADAPGPSDTRPRRTRRARVTWPQIRDQWPLALVLGGLLVALGFVMFERWRRGAFILGVVALAAAVLRGALPDARARLLGVRGKGFDVVVYTVFGGVVLWLAMSIDSLGTG